MHQDSHYVLKTTFKIKKAFFILEIGVCDFDSAFDGFEGCFDSKPST